MVLEKEISRWSGFHRALRYDDRVAYEELLDVFRSYASEIQCAVSQRMFECLAISVALDQAKRIAKLEKELKINEPEAAKEPENKRQSLPEPPIHKPMVQPAKKVGGQTRIRKLIHQLYVKAGLLKQPKGRWYDLRVHSLRKYFKTQLLALGVQADYVDYWMAIHRTHTTIFKV